MPKLLCKAQTGLRLSLVPKYGPSFGNWLPGQRFVGIGWMAQNRHNSGILQPCVESRSWLTCTSNRSVNKMIYFATALAFVWPTWYSLRGGWQGERGFQIAGFDTNALGLGLLAIAAAVYFWGMEYGIALIVAVAIHEFGHVAAFRVCGHADARFRLIPMMGGVAISNQVPASADKAFFITLMGPAINLGPMVFCFAVSESVFAAEFASEIPYQIASYLYVQGMVIAALNFFNLLPLWPFDGGKLTQSLTFSFAPDLTRSVSLAMMGFAVLLCLATQSLFLLFFVLFSWPSLMQSENLLHLQRPLSRKRALLSLAAYIATAAAFFAGGHPLMKGFF